MEPGMCYTVEPGIYLSERNGVRIEDNLLDGVKYGGIFVLAAAVVVAVKILTLGSSRCFHVV